MKNTKGFTLVEVVVVVVVVAILASIATPAIMNWMPNIRFRGAIQEMFGDMHLAKIEAAKRGVNVVVVFNNVDCSAVPGSMPNPGGGYTIFADDGSGGGVAKNHTQEGSEATLVQRVMPNNVGLCESSFVDGWTGFKSNGLVAGNKLGKVIIKNDHGREATMSLTMAGGVRMQ